jgi:hypothetical protein
LPIDPAFGEPCRYTPFLPVINKVEGKPISKIGESHVIRVLSTSDTRHLFPLTSSLIFPILNPLDPYDQTLISTGNQRNRPLLRDRECLKLSLGKGSPSLQIRAVTVAAKIALIRSFTGSLLSVRSIIAKMLPPLFILSPGIVCSAIPLMARASGEKL